MSAKSDLHQFVYRRLNEQFGQANSALGRDDHWSIMPGPYRTAINVLVDGTGDIPAVWVFDPHAEKDGVYRKAISGEADLNEAIREIQARVKRAAMVPPKAEL